VIDRRSPSSDSTTSRYIQPADWTGFEAQYRFRETAYRLRIERGEMDEVTLDEQTLPGNRVPLVNDGREREVTVRVAAVQPAPASAPEVAAAK
jgi:cellobiose phosphorylase